MIFAYYWYKYVLTNSTVNNNTDSDNQHAEM